MAMKQTALTLMAGLLLAGTGFADGDDGPRCRNCPPGDYSILHYWFPGWYEARAEFHPKNFDQYPPGPSPSVPPTYQYGKHRCPGVAPAPSSPYADPESYYGRPIAPR